MFPSNREKRAVQAIMGVLGSAVKVWHCGAAELLGRLIINPDNEPFLLPFVPQVKIFTKKKKKSLAENMFTRNEEVLHHEDSLKFYRYISAWSIL